MEMRVQVDAFFPECAVGVKLLLEKLKILADSGIPSVADRIQRCIESVRKLSRNDAARLALVEQIHGDYLWAESVIEVTPLHHRLAFVPGAGGIDFAQDFCYFMIGAGAERVTAVVRCIEFHEEDERAFNLVFDHSAAACWTKQYRS